MELLVWVFWLLCGQREDIRWVKKILSTFLFSSKSTFMTEVNCVDRSNLWAEDITEYHRSTIFNGIAAMPLKLNSALFAEKSTISNLASSKPSRGPSLQKAYFHWTKVNLNYIFAYHREPFCFWARDWLTKHGKCIDLLYFAGTNQKIFTYNRTITKFYQHFR